MIITVLESIHANANLLKGKNDEMKKFLKKQGNPDSQGTGNAPTHQECAFADLLKKNGFEFLSKGTPVPTDDGNYYFYQPNGTQRNIDFLVINIAGGIRSDYKFDLKHTKGKTFYFNDGWFENDVIYIISFTIKKTDKVYIGYGQETPTDEEHKSMLEMIEFKKSWNKTKKNIGNLKKCIRYANQYSCDGFTPEFSEEKFKSVQMKLSLTPPTS
jgi:hypothetical protein